ncbi:MAG: T9SS type A sorting domain-containing protein, partial [Candidatus Latescibacteria bacterium]|nr:T9SS type A sorting domain-containing protein [Candidatus Latescibacterota bacterium]
ANVDLDISQSGGGKIKINSLVIEDYPWNGIYFKDVPIQVTALPDLGYRFIGWTGVTPEDSPSLEITLTDNISVAAVFEKIGDDIVLDRYHSPYEIKTDQVISAGKTLTVGPGVELIMSENANIYVHDELHLNGTSDQPITIRPADNTSNWGAICLDNAAGASTLSNVVIKGAGTGRDWDTFSAAVSVMNSDITLDNVQFEDNAQSIFARGGSVTVRNCLFTETNNNEHINIVEADALVENCTFQNIIMGDAIDFDGITNGIIRNNKILGTMDSDGDGIDIGDDCSGVLITNNVIFDCADKGISVGEGAKDIKIERNVIAGCLYGIAVKDSANAFIDHNTLYNNDIAVAAYEKGVERFGGGTAVITNSILSKSGISTLYTDELSSITVSYTLADTELLPGEGNIQADPEFVSPLYRDFNLLSVSPAIDAGDPQSVLDPDETRSDMGMKFSQEADINIVINEINYNSSGDFNPDDWLELYNPNNEEIDLSGWVLKDEDDTHVFVLPINTVISGGEYFVLCRDAAAFHGMFPDVNKYAGDFGFGFNAAGELVRLYNSQGALVDYLAYDDETPWPLSPDGNGPTLSLINPDLDNEVPVNWGISHDHGTPGTENETITGVDETIFPNAFSLGQNYPNPFNPTTTITFSVPKKSFSELVIYNIMGQKVRTLISGELTPGNHSAAWDGRDDDGHAVSSGVYFSHLSIGEKVAARSMMLVK